MIRRAVAGVALVAVGLVVPWSAAVPGAAATSRALPACTVTLASGSTENAPLQLADGEVLCAPGTFTNGSTITVASGGSAVIEAPHLVNHGSVEVGEGTTLQLTNSPANLRGTKLTGGAWTAAGTLSLPGEITTLAADVTLSGAGEIENSTDGSNAVDSLSTIKATGTLALTTVRTSGPGASGRRAPSYSARPESRAMLSTGRTPEHSP